MLSPGTQGPSQSGLCPFDIICLLPTCTIHSGQIGLRAVPCLGHSDWCLGVFLHALVLGDALLLSSRGHGSALAGPLCAPRAPCTFSLSAPPLATLLQSLVMCCVLSPALISILPHPCQLKFCPSFKNQLKHCHLFSPLQICPYKYFVALLYLIIIILN